MYAWVLVITCCSCKCPNKWTLPHTFPNTKTQVRAHSCLKRSQGLHRHHVLTPLQKVHPILVWKSINTNTTLLNVVLSTLPTCENSSCEGIFCKGFYFFFFSHFPHPIVYIYFVSIFIEEKGEQLIWSLQFLVTTESKGVWFIYFLFYVFYVNTMNSVVIFFGMQQQITRPNARVSGVWWRSWQSRREEARETAPQQSAKQWTRHTHTR